MDWIAGLIEAVEGTERSQAIGRRRRKGHEVGYAIPGISLVAATGF